MKLPSFLIIGAQKSGTTTLYRDLLTQPGVFFPYIKEPNNLSDERVLTAAGLSEYADLYKTSKDSDIRGDASTGYSRHPRFPNVPERAKHLLGPDIKLIYIIREPVSRIVSNHHHMFTNAECSPTIEEFFGNDEHYCIDTSRYAKQIRTWLEHFPLSSMRVLIFEEYTKRRREVIEELAPFLGFTAEPDLVDPDSRFNAAADRSSDRGLFMRIQRSSLYGRLRPLMSPATRDRLRKWLAPKAPPPPPPPTAETVESMLETLEPDQRELAELMGRPYPIWDPAKVRAKYDKLRAAAQSSS